jgi:hypothetical protein
LAWAKANSQAVVDDVRVETSTGTKHFLLVFETTKSLEFPGKKMQTGEPRKPAKLELTNFQTDTR